MASSAAQSVGAQLDQCVEVLLGLQGAEVGGSGSVTGVWAGVPPSTAAAPPMSAFIVSMAFAGLRDRPPESNVIPLPASTSVFSAPGGACSSRTSLGGCTQPRPPPLIPPYPPPVRSSSSTPMNHRPPPAAHPPAPAATPA